MDQDQINHMTGAIMGMMGFFMLFGFVIVAFLVFLYWRILTKAGLAGPLALLVLVPGIGWIIVVCILAFSDWRVTPLPPTYGGLQPYPPPPTSYQPPVPVSYSPPPPPPTPPQP
jgi:uncharacterized membrane protein YhaH (DUF805 family)